MIICIYEWENRYGINVYTKPQCRHHGYAKELIFIAKYHQMEWRNESAEKNML